jgi:F420 biosynthesis protein FbiB-like protein
MEHIQIAIQAACLAPSPHGTAPWRFCVLSTPEAKKKLAEEMGQDFLRDMAKEGVSEEERKRRHNGSIRLLTQAPLIILAALSYQDLDDYEDRAKQACERMMAEHSLGAALQNLMLALTAQGIGSVWRCAPLFCPETARQSLDLPSDWVPRALIVAGKPASAPPPKEIPVPEIIVR